MHSCAFRNASLLHTYIQRDADPRMCPASDVCYSKSQSHMNVRTGEVHCGHLHTYSRSESAPAANLKNVQAEIVCSCWYCVHIDPRNSVQEIVIYWLTSVGTGAEKLAP